MKAFVYRTGVIGFGHDAPPVTKTLPIVSGPQVIVQHAVKSCARQIGKGKGYEIPGIANASGDDDVMEALLAFRERVERKMQRLSAKPAVFA